jgi:hypothetical protein
MGVSIGIGATLEVEVYLGGIWSWSFLVGVIFEIPKITRIRERGSLSKGEGKWQNISKNDIIKPQEPPFAHACFFSSGGYR